jgi:hypothetical protein
MNDQFANPPAMVKASETIDELVAAGKAINEAINRGERLNLEKFLELGKIVNKLKETCQHGEFTPACFKMGLSQQRVSECGRAAKLPAPVLLQCNSIKEAIEASRDKPPDPVVSHDPPESEGNNGEAIEAAWDKPPDPVVSSDPPESEGSNGTVSPDHQVPLNGFFDIPRAGPKTEPPPASVSPSLLCRDCRIHKPKSNCKRCAELRKPHRQLAAREPGEDDDTYGNPVGPCWRSSAWRKSPNTAGSCQRRKTSAWSKAAGLRPSVSR